ncbi:MAG TPA: hypothetical protein VF868_05450 [Bacteroidia bacterium]|jgi:hypothetical protein
MKNKNYHGIGMPFEGFMRRAFRTQERSISKGTCASIYETLVRIEDGTALVKVSYNKQLRVVKSSLTKGINAFLKQKIQPAEALQLEKLVQELNSANHTVEVDYIIKEALRITLPYKEWDSI